MRKIILELVVSLDGYIEGPNQEIDWITFDEESATHLNEFTHEIDTVMYGRVSYELWGQYIPPEDSMEGEKSFYAAVHQMTKYVFSQHLNQVEGKARLIRGDIKEQVMAIKKQAGKDIWLFGGSGLITTFINLNLIDEYRIGIIPVLLGAGKPLFQNIARQVDLTLLQAKTSTSGMLVLYYQPRTKQNDPSGNG